MTLTDQKRQVRNLNKQKITHKEQGVYLIHPYNCKLWSLSVNHTRCGNTVDFLQVPISVLSTNI